METICIKIPESIHKNLKELAKKDGVSIDQFITTAVSEKISAFMTKQYLEDRARRGSKNKFQDALSKVPDVEPEEYDKL
ncbi:MAG: toxin-antitoxin system HicB family antitoxin [Candidatus Aminicenantes bacterium]|nr:MAG: toxin-antitoxin system HicB family antitoxin [Candidatus Aminicenantes bacterium]